MMSLSTIEVSIMERIAAEVPSPVAIVIEVETKTTIAAEQPDPVAFLMEV